MLRSISTPTNTSQEPVTTTLKGHLSAQFATNKVFAQVKTELSDHSVQLEKHRQDLG